MSKKPAKMAIFWRLFLAKSNKMQRNGHFELGVQLRIASTSDPEVSFDFWSDGPNRVEELGSEISDVLII